MQVMTIWQPAYTPPPIRTMAPKAAPVPRNFKRAYLVFGRSKTAQRVLDVIEQSDGITAMDLIYKTKLMGVCQYVRTLKADGLIKSKPMAVAHARQKVQHYWGAT